jgi:ankyrin repeat protein
VGLDDERQRGDDEPEPSLVQIWGPVLAVAGFGTLLAVAVVAVPLVLFSQTLSSLELWPGSTTPCETPGQRLWFAAAGGDVATVEAELSAADAPDERVDAGLDGWTPLLCAVDHQQAQAAQVLLDAGADPDLAIGGRTSALAMAAEDGDLDLIDTLLDAGADPNNDLGGTTPLVRAAEGEQPEAIGALLAAGADPAVANERGATPLLIAARGHSISTAALLEGGADPNQVLQVDGQQVLVESGLWRLPLESGVTEPLLRGRGDVTALHAAALGDDVESTRILLQAGADPDAVAFGAYTPLHAAMTGKRDEHIEALLLLAGADPTLAPNEQVGTPADLAASLAEQP